MAGVAERVAAGATATTHQHRGRLLQPQLVGHATAAEVGAIAEPAMLAAAAAAELMHPGWQVKRLGARGRGCGVSHGHSELRGSDGGAAEGSSRQPHLTGSMQRLHSMVTSKEYAVHTRPSSSLARVRHAHQV